MASACSAPLGEREVPLLLVRSGRGAQAAKHALGEGGSDGSSGSSVRRALEQAAAALVQIGFSAEAARAMAAAGIQAEALPSFSAAKALEAMSEHGARLSAIQQRVFSRSYEVAVRAAGGYEQSTTAQLPRETLTLAQA